MKKQKNKGISLIVLVITIIVMIILAATIMISLSNNGILGRSEEAVDVTNIKHVETLAQTAWSEAYLYYKEKAEIATQEKLETKVNEILAKSNIDISKYVIKVTEQGVVVSQKPLEIQPGLYETESNYTKLKASWEELLMAGTIHVSDVGVVYTNFDFSTGVDASANLLIGDLVLPEGITAIGNLDLTTLTGNVAFYGCTGLTNVNIPKSVRSLAPLTFYGCVGLSEVIIPKGTTSLLGALAYCGLTSITVEQGNTAYHSAGNCLIETASKSLVVGTSSSVIPLDGSVTSILGGAFYGCTELTSVIFPKEVSEIGYETFYGCTNLKEVTFSTTLQMLDDYAFYECPNISNVYYEGTAEQWAQINIQGGNSSIKSAAITYNHVYN